MGEDHNVEEDNTNVEIIVELEADEFNSLQLAKRSLVGKVLSSKSLNKGSVRNILAKAWGEPANLKVTDMGTNLFLFSFESMKDMKGVLSKGPWVSFWIQIHGLPLEMMNTSNAARIMNRVGEVMEVENPSVEGNPVRTFIRARV
ncbi:hypothetical protein SESBI_17815 [Sesbania bispinosa]|nr:hypothetical protein SESBI_17815 [Sesbania bispinosa]